MLFAWTDELYWHIIILCICLEISAKSHILFDDLAFLKQFLASQCKIVDANISFC